ncbi:MAG: pilus assembly protein PilM [Sedimentisphaerales bacterium]
MKKTNRKSFVMDIRKNVFGIDICKNVVSFTQLQKNGSQIKVIRAGNVPLDQTVVNNGVVQDTATLAKAVKQLKISKIFKNNDAVLTICAEPVLLQILKLPDSVLGEAKKFVQNEVRQYAVLPLKNIEMDYCGLRSADAQTKRVLVGATQTEYLNMTAKAIEKNNINVRTIEPAVVALIRACYNRVIKPAGEKNIMILLVRDDTLNLCVFEKQRLEFLRTKKFESCLVGPQQLNNLLKCEVESVLQFYEIEKAAKSQSWRIIVACSPENNRSVQIAGEIRSQIPRQDVEITAFENSLMDVTIDEEVNKDISPVAAGAAMKLLDEGSIGIKLNLLPKEIVEARKDRKELLIIANVAVFLFTLLFLYIALLGKKSINISRSIDIRKQKQVGVNILALADSKKDINGKIKLIENNLAAIQNAVDGRTWHGWAALLVELAGAVPQTILMERLDTRDDNTMKIEGLAINYEAVNSFVNLLEQNRKISSVSLNSAGQSAKYGGGLIDYSIVCFLAK